MPSASDFYAKHKRDVCRLVTYIGRDTRAKLHAEAARLGLPTSALVYEGLLEMATRYNFSTDTKARLARDLGFCTRSWKDLEGE